MKINCEVAIEIDLENGVYEFEHQGGTGKTYLCKLLTKLSQEGYPFATVTYKEGAVVVTGDLETAKLIIFDRLDLYVQSYNMEQMEKLGSHAIVLLVLKSYVYSEDDGSWGRALTAYIEYDGESIKVH